MHGKSVIRAPRGARTAITAGTVLAAAVAAAAALGATPASAATARIGTGDTAAASAAGASLTLSPSSGSDYTSDSATLSWTLPSACVGDVADVFLYKGTGAWNSAAINEAEGNSGDQSTYFNFYDNESVSSTSGSVSWPDTASGYQAYGSGAAYASTGSLVSALGTGYYTVGIACVNPSTYTPVTGSNGAPIGTYKLVDLGATGNSWQVSSLVPTQVALTGAGTAGSSQKVALSAKVTASNGSVPKGGVNFYAGDSATGTPLNGSTPVPVKNGTAVYAGDSGYASGTQGAQPYTAVYVPATCAQDTASSDTASADLIAEAVVIKVTATQDASDPSSLDLTATAVGTPTSLSTLLPDGGVNFIVDGNVIDNRTGGYSVPFEFNSSGVATDTVTGLASGTHTVTAELTNSADGVENASTGYAVVVNTTQATTGS